MSQEPIETTVIDLLTDLKKMAEVQKTLPVDYSQPNSFYRRSDRIMERLRNDLNGAGIDVLEWLMDAEKVPQERRK